LWLEVIEAKEQRQSANRKEAKDFDLS